MSYGLAILGGLRAAGAWKGLRRRSQRKLLASDRG